MFLKNNTLKFLFIFTFIFIRCTMDEKLTDWKGPYIGQKPPGMTPEIFAPGIVSTGASEFGSTFPPNGDSFYYAISGVPKTIIAFMEFKGNRWTKPQTASFSGVYNDWDLNLSHDGKKLYYTSNRPLVGKGEPLDNSNLWVVERSETGWSEPRALGNNVNTDGSENYPSVTRDGTLYYFHSDKCKKRDPDVFYSKLKDGYYSKPVRLGNTVNSQYQEWDPFIASDESYIIFGSVDRPGGFGGCDLYISFHNSDGSWTPAVNMGESINSNANEFCPNVTSDGKYLFFTSRRRKNDIFDPNKSITYKEKMKLINSPGNGEGDIYWVNAKIIDDYRPEDLK